MDRSNEHLGTERIGRLLRRFSIPCVLSLFIASSYNIADQIYIGNSAAGYLGNAAIGIAFPILIMVQAFAWCFGDAAAAFLAICQGRKEMDKADKAAGISIVFGLVISIVLMAGALHFKEPLLRLFGASDLTIGYSSSYLKIVSYFFPAFMLLNVINPIIRSDGSPVWSMVSMGFGALANIILDPIFIYVLDWGVEGAAWATAIGQAASLALNVAYLFRTKTFKMRASSFVPNFKLLKEFLPLGISSFITQMSIVAISLVCNAMLFKYGTTSVYGADIPIAAVSVETKIYTILINIVVGIVLGGQPIFGYNIGAGKIDRVKKTYGLIFLITLIISAVFTLVNEVYPDIFFLPFGSMDQPLYVEYSRKVFRFFMSSAIFTCLIKMTSIFFQSCGKPFQAIASSILRDIILFIPFAILIPMIAENRNPGDGIVALLFSAAAADIIAVAVDWFLVSSYFKNIDSYNKRFGTGVVFPDDYKVEYPSRKGPVITISREHGSNGKFIGSLLAQKLSIPFFDKDILNMMAKERNLPATYSMSSGMKVGISNSLYLSKDFNWEAIAAQRSLVCDVAEMGSCVIVGRAADYHLRENPNVVRIFIYADKKTKIRNTMKFYGDSSFEARKQMRRSDLSRALYYRNITGGGKWKSRNNYDLFIDSSSGDEKTADMLAGMIRGMYPEMK